ncbi:MAG: hypothetical protein ABIN67_13885 [Ferruginibacter sp.]
MVIKWDEWIKRDRGSLLFLGYVSFVIVIVFLYLDFSKPNLKSEKDLIFINGSITSFNFLDGFRGTHNYTFTLNGYYNTFQIKADFLNIFKSSDFKNIPSDQQITVGIPKDFKSSINTNKKLFIYSLTSNEQTYLDCTKALKKHNGHLMKIFSGIFLLAGFIFIHFGNKSKIKTPIFW